MNLSEIPDEKIIIPGLLVLAVISYFVPGEHKTVDYIVSGLLGYMTKMSIDRVRQLNVPPPATVTSTKEITIKETAEGKEDGDTK